MTETAREWARLKFNLRRASCMTLLSWAVRVAPDADKLSLIQSECDHYNRIEWSDRSQPVKL